VKNIKLFLEYTNNTRSSSLTEEEFIRLLNNNCTDWLRNPSMLIRFKNKVDDKFSLIDPKLHVRKSISDLNYVTILLDNLPSWSEFPKRSESVIFSYGIKNNRGAFGGELYFIIPFDNANFGVSPSSDLWAVKNNDVFDYSLTEDILHGFSKMGAPTNYSDFSKWASNQFSHDTISEFENNGRGNYMTRSIFIKYKDHKDIPFMEWFDNISSPSNWYRNNVYGFKLLDYNGLVNLDLRGGKGDHGRECWTDSNCLIYHVGDIPQSYSNDIEKIYKMEFDRMVRRFMNN